MSQRNKNIYFGSLEDELSSTVIETESMNVNRVNESTVSARTTETTKTNETSNYSTASQSKPSSSNLTKSLQIPTDDSTVRSHLILLNQPITLFGEGPAERRDRLRMMAGRALSSLPNALELFPILKQMLGSGEKNLEDNSDAESDSDDEEFWVPGAVDLLQVRSFLLQDSISRAKAQISVTQTAEHSKRSVLYAKLTRELDLRGSTVDSSGRPLSACVFNSEGQLITGDLGGRIVKYHSQGSKIIKELGDRITAMCSEGDLFMTGTATGTIQLHRGDNENIHVLSIDTKHAVTSINCHPSSKFFATTSADSLWRLWDPLQNTPVQVQEGHVGGISSGAWHPHGGIYCTGGTGDGVVRVWDCRMGRAIWNIPATCSTTALAFSPQSPHLLASASADGLISLHDLRKLQAAYCKTAAHRSACTALKFGAGGRVVVSSGFDGHVRVWGPGDLRLIKELPVGSAKVTDMDVFTDIKDDQLRIAAVTFDKCIKTYSTQ